MLKSLIHRFDLKRQSRDETGFTLIELLIVILIIAILSAVGILTLLSALGAAQKSAAKTTLATAILAAKSVQAGSGNPNYSAITESQLNAAEPDLSFIVGSVNTTQVASTVGMLSDPSLGAAFNTVDSQGHCFYASITNYGTYYNSAKISSGDCPDETDAVIGNPATWKSDQRNGWNL